VNNLVYDLVVTGLAQVIARAASQRSFAGQQLADDNAKAVKSVADTTLALSIPHAETKTH
jgi:hypothetical protein